MPFCPQKHPEIDQEPNWPAAVVPSRVKGALSSAQAQADEGVVHGERHVAEGVHAVGLVVHVLPVGAEARGAGRVVAVQVIVQLADYLLVHHSFKFAGKESWPGSLLWWGERKRQAEDVNSTSLQLKGAWTATVVKTQLKAMQLLNKNADGSGQDVRPTCAHQPEVPPRQPALQECSALGSASPLSLPSGTNSMTSKGTGADQTEGEAQQRFPLFGFKCLPGRSSTTGLSWLGGDYAEMLRECSPITWNLKGTGWLQSAALLSMLSLQTTISSWIFRQHCIQTR